MSVRGTASGKIARYIRPGGAKGKRLESALPRPCHRIPLPRRKPGDDSAEGLDSHSTMRSGGTTRKEEDPRARCKRGIISRRVSNLIANAVRRPEGGKREGGGEASELRRSHGCGRGWVVLLRYWPGSEG